MGRASSAKKVSRAARAAGRPGARRNLAWPATIAAVVVVGVGLLLVTLAGDDDDQGPLLTDHWHAAYGIDNCGTFEPPLADVVQDLTGLHTHRDGLIHLHPFTSKYTGSGATLAAWGETVGLELTDTSIKAAGIDVENGDECEDGPGEVQVKVWDGIDDEVGRVLEKDVADYRPQDGDLVTIAFLPAGAEIPRPPDSAIASLGAPIDLNPGATTTTTSTTVPAGDGQTTTTTSTTAPG
jgi:hypothetical protein